MLLFEDFADRIMRLLSGYPQINISIPFADTLKSWFTTIKHGIQVTFSPVEHLFPLILEGNDSLSPNWLCLEPMDDKFILISSSS